MSQDWENSRSYYSNLTLIRDGDDVEKYAAENYRLHERWPAYERFWRIHVAPATQRPAGIEIRPGVSQIVFKLITANYRSFSDVVSACDCTAMLQTDVGFARSDDWRRLFSLIADSVAAFMRVTEFAEELLASLNSSAALQNSMGNDWRNAYRQFEAYQQYLSALDLNSVKWLDLDSGRTALVACKGAVLNDVYGTDLSASEAENRPFSYIRLVDAIRLHLDDLIGVLNLGHELLIASLEGVGETSQYRKQFG